MKEKKGEIRIVEKTETINPNEIDISKLTQEQINILFAQLSAKAAPTVKADVQKKEKSEKEKAVENFNKLFSRVHDEVNGVVGKYANDLITALDTFRDVQADGPKTSKSMKAFSLTHKGKTVRIIPQFIFDFQPPKRALSASEKIQRAEAERAAKAQAEIEKIFAESNQD